MATKIHQTGTRPAMTFKHDDHDDVIIIFPTGMINRWYVIREHGHDSIAPIMIRTASEIFELFGFEIEAWQSNEVEYAAT